MLVQYWMIVGNRLYALLLLTGLDFVFGVALALWEKRFDWAYLTGFVRSDLFPIFAWLGVSTLELIPADLVPDGVSLAVSWVVYTPIFGTILASVMGHFSAMGVLTNGLQKLGVKPTNQSKG